MKIERMRRINANREAPGGRAADVGWVRKERTEISGDAAMWRPGPLLCAAILLQSRRRISPAF